MGPPATTREADRVLLTGKEIGLTSRGANLLLSAFRPVLTQPRRPPEDESYYSYNELRKFRMSCICDGLTS